MKRIVIGFAAVLGILFFSITLLQQKIGLISYTLIVGLESPGVLPIRVDYTVCRTPSDADFLCSLTVEEYHRWEVIHTNANYKGGPLEVDVRGGDREDAFGRTISRWQEEYLVILAYWPDGRRVAKIVTIPDSRVAKHISVTLP